MPFRIEWDESSLQKLAPRDGRDLPYAGYPRLKRFHDGKVVAVYEAQGNMEMIQSADDGKTWDAPNVVFHGHISEDSLGNSVKINIANPEIIELQNGDWVAACNYRPSKDGVAPFAIAISRSEDQGNTWSEAQVVFNAGLRFTDGCWEPALLQLPNGILQVYFANEGPYTTSDEQEISVLASADNGKTWESEPRTVSFRANRRDGMPVPILTDNEILMAIEDNKVGQFKPYIVRSSINDNWNTPVTGDSPLREYALQDSLPDEVYAGAPYLTRLPSGEVLLSYQTTRGRGDDWEKSTMEVAIGDKNGRNFGNASQPFSLPLDGEAKWNAISMWNDSTVVATSATDIDGSVGAWMILGRIVFDQE
ncbi:exo-alpha-sialidase [Olivibacter sp. SDN3]|uniref:sialidase family protein n=1 Tax=Olivibacter sp. SDN3 TaxID=2764720 RepID=UPI00165107BC|nr:sialidase family protein [Olivibacter sp. SDN3]QNL48031.1 exo-alpha-sialidase [Olivibacter sp. SDN3]